MFDKKKYAIRKQKQRIAKYKDYIENSSKWKLIRKIVFKDRGKVCERCESTENLQVHHKSYMWLFEEEKNLDSLEILCHNCHKKYHLDQGHKFEQWNWRL